MSASSPAPTASTGFWANARSGSRRLVVVVLVVLSCLSLFASTLGIWAGRNALDTSVVSDRLGELGADPQVQAALGDLLTAQIMELIDAEEFISDALPERGAILAIPLAGAVETFVHDRVDAYLTSDAFAAQWKAVVTRAHEAAVKVLKGESTRIQVEDGKVVINLLPVINSVLEDITGQSPEILGRTIELPTITADDLPAQARIRLSEAIGRPIDEDFGVVAAFDASRLGVAQDAVAIFEAAVWAFVFVTFAALIGAMALTRYRRRTALQLAVGAALVFVVIRRAAKLLLSEVVKPFKVEENAQAVAAAVHAMVDPLLAFTGWLLAGSLLAVVVLVLTGPYSFAVRFRALLGSATETGVGKARETMADPQAQAWVALHRGALQAAGAAVLVAALLWWETSWLGYLLLAVLVGVYEVLVVRLADRAPTSA